MFTELVQRLVKKAIENNPAPEKIYKGGDGLLHCGICGEPIQQIIEPNVIFQDGIAPSECECMREKRYMDEKERARRKAEERVAELQKMGLSDPAYLRMTFENDKGFSPAARSAAEWYADNFPELRKAGKGLMFMGSTGTGKTFFACCIANALIKKGVPVWVTTMRPLLRKLGDFSTAETVLNQIKSFELLILDDFGTSQATARNLDLLYDAVDTRYRSGKPMIITTNLAPDDINDAPLELQRIYSRIKEMCLNCEKSPVRMSGADHREEIARQAHMAVS